MQARILAVSAITLNGVFIPAEGVFATLDFPDTRLAEFFAQRLGWSAFRVEIGGAEVDVHPTPLSEVEGAPGALPEAAGLLAALESLGIKTLGDLAAADIKALQAAPAIGTARAGSLTRAAKRRLVELRHAALEALNPQPKRAPATGIPLSGATVAPGETGEASNGAGGQPIAPSKDPKPAPAAKAKSPAKPSAKAKSVAPKPAKA